MVVPLTLQSGSFGRRVGGLYLWLRARINSSAASISVFPLKKRFGNGERDMYP
jgi:hypothetical protein